MSRYSREEFDAERPIKVSKNSWLTIPLGVLFALLVGFAVGYSDYRDKSRTIEEHELRLRKVEAGQEAIKVMGYKLDLIMDKLDVRPRSAATHSSSSNGIAQISPN